MPEPKEPPAPPPGRVYVLFRGPHSKNFQANIVLPGGKYQEIFDTGATLRKSAICIANGRIRRLYREHRIESPQQYKERTGSRLSVAAIRRALAQGLTPDERLAPEEAEASPSNGAPQKEERASVDANWGRNLVRIESKFSMGFQRIMNLMLLGVGNNDAVEFREHVRAIVAEVALSGMTPTGKLQRKYKNRSD
jgi:hypothetical protein